MKWMKSFIAEQMANKAAKWQIQHLAEGSGAAQHAPRITAAKLQNKNQRLARSKKIKIKNKKISEQESN